MGYPPQMHYSNAQLQSELCRIPEKVAVAPIMICLPALTNTILLRFLDMNVVKGIIVVDIIAITGIIQVPLAVIIIIRLLKGEGIIKHVIIGLFALEFFHLKLTMYKKYFANCMEILPLIKQSNPKLFHLYYFE